MGAFLFFWYTQNLLQKKKDKPADFCVKNTVKKNR